VLVLAVGVAAVVVGAAWAGRAGSRVAAEGQGLEPARASWLSGSSSCGVQLVRADGDVLALVAPLLDRPAGYRARAPLAGRDPIVRRMGLITPRPVVITVTFIGSRRGLRGRHRRDGRDLHPDLPRCCLARTVVHSPQGQPTHPRVREGSDRGGGGC